MVGTKVGQKLCWLGRDERLYGLPSAGMEATTKSDGALANRQQVPVGGAALWAAAPGARQEPGSVNPTNDPLKNTDLGGEGIASTHCKDKGPVLDPSGSLPYQQSGCAGAMGSGGMRWGAPRQEEGLCPKMTNASRNCLFRATAGGTARICSPSGTSK